MGSKLIKLEGTLVQVEVAEDSVREISANLAKSVDATFDQLKAILSKVCSPIAEAWGEMNKQLVVDQAEVELALSFEASGNLFIANSKAGVNLKVKLVLKAPPTEPEKPIV